MGKIYNRKQQQLSHLMAQAIDADPIYENLFHTFSDQYGYMELLKLRHKFIRNFSFAVPNAEAIQVLCDLSPLTEIGCGNGYWTWRVRQAGGDGRGYDAKIRISERENLEPEIKAKYRHLSWEVSNHERFWIYPIAKCSRDATAEPDRTLVLCWPDYKTDMAFNCLNRYEGENFVYIGEGFGGACANDKFFELLQSHWTLKNIIEIPNFLGVHDAFFHFQRRRGNR